MYGGALQLQFFLKKSNIWAPISDKNYGRNCHFDNFLFLSLLPVTMLRNYEQNFRQLMLWAPTLYWGEREIKLCYGLATLYWGRGGSSYVMGSQHCIGGRGWVFKNFFKIPVIFCHWLYLVIWIELALFKEMAVLGSKLFLSG